MGFPRPSLGELVAQARANISSRTRGSAFIKRSVEYVLAAVQGALTNGLHAHLEWNQRQALPTTAEIESLLGWGQWLKVERKGAVKAVGQALFEGTPGTVGPAFTQLQSPDGVLFETTAARLVDSGGLWTPSIRAVVAGTSGNFDAGAPLALVSPISGIDSTGQVLAIDGQGTTGGEDVEDTEDYRPRVIDGMRTPPAGGGPGDYVQWAREVPGVTRAWEFGNANGYGTVSVGFVMDNRADIIPTAADVASVQAYIESVRPLDMRAAYVQAPILFPVNITLSVSPNTASVRTAVLNELQLLFLREPSLGRPMARSKVDEAISTAPGEEDHVISNISTLSPSQWGLLSLGSVIFT